LELLLQIAASPAVAEQTVVPAKNKNLSGPRAKPVPRLPENLPVVEEVIEPEPVKAAPQQWRFIGEEVSEQLDYEPGRFLRRRIVRKKYVHRFEVDRAPLIAPLPDKLQERGLAAPGLLAQIIVGKYCDHLPLYRQEQIFAQRYQVHLPRQTLTRWMELCADWLKPIYEHIRTGVMAGGYLFTSDWGLADVIEEAFPGFIQRGGEIAQLNTAIYPKRGSATHPFLREVFCKVQADRVIERTIDHAWQIDVQSFAISYDAAKVVVLMEAPELQASAVPTAVAVTFNVGGGAPSPVATGGVYEDFPSQKGGKVLHVLSHFSKQKNKQDGYTLQNMLLNFLIEAKDRKRLSEKK
jgi:transposase